MTMERQRATFQKTDCDGLVVFSLNLTRMQTIVTILVGLTALAGSLAAAAAWTKASVAEMAREVFYSQLEGYHQTMRPQLFEKVEGTIDAKIAEHKIEAEKPFERRLDQIEGRLTTLESSTRAEIAATRRDISRMEGKIDRLLER